MDMSIIIQARSIPILCKPTQSLYIRALGFSLNIYDLQPLSLKSHTAKHNSLARSNRQNLNKDTQVFTGVCDKTTFANINGKKHLLRERAEPNSDHSVSSSDCSISSFCNEKKHEFLVKYFLTVAFYLWTRDLSNSGE